MPRPLPDYSRMALFWQTSWDFKEHGAHIKFDIDWFNGASSSDTVSERLKGTNTSCAMKQPNAS